MSGLTLCCRLWEMASLSKRVMTLCTQIWSICSAPALHLHCVIISSVVSGWVSCSRTLSLLPHSIGLYDGTTPKLIRIFILILIYCNAGATEQRCSHSGCCRVVHRLFWKMPPRRRFPSSNALPRFFSICCLFVSKIMFCAVLKQSSLCVLLSVRAGCAIFMPRPSLLRRVAGGGASGRGFNTQYGGWSLRISRRF